MQTNYFSIYESQLGTWYVKGYSGWIYIVTTASSYPAVVAVESVDELHAIFEEGVQKKIWGSTARRAAARDQCCMGIAVKYSTLEPGSAAHALTSQVDDDLRLSYSKSIKNLLQEVDALKHQLAKNIEGALKNIEKAEVVEKKCAECLELAKVFKKRARRLSWSMWAKRKKFEIAGAAIFGTGGFIAGFLVGGPACAGVLTGMSSVAGAQLIEASIGALLFVAGFVGAKSTIETWFWNQKLVVL